MAKKKKKNTEHREDVGLPKAKSRRPLYIFIATIVLLSIILLTITSMDWFLTISKPILEAYTSISSAILNILGQGTTAKADNILSPDFSMQIKKGCDAIAPMILLSAGILAFPAGLKQKLQGLVVGVIGLAVLNIIRIISLYFFGKYTSYSFFDFMHTDVWQIFFIICTIMFWLAWIKWSNSKSLAHATN